MKEIINKFKFRDTPVVIHAPVGLEEAFAKLGCKTSFDTKEKSANTLVFINSNKEYLDFLNKQLKHVVPDSVLWFAYPKGTSGIKTDINRDTIRETGEKYNLTTVTAVSIDDIWSALRFRPIDKVGT